MKFKTQEELIEFIKVEAGKGAAEIVDEQMAKIIERANAQEKTIAGLMSRIDQKQRSEDEGGERVTLQFARMIRALAGTKGNVGEAADRLKKWGHEDQAKALAEGTGSAGGYLVAPDQGEYVERLVADSVVRKLGARVIPMPNGSIGLPAGDTGATAYWVGENENATNSQPALRQVNLTAKKLMVVVPISNELLEDASGAADQWVETEAKTAASLAEDLAYLRGAGTEHSPQGLRTQVASANSFNITHSGAAATIAEIYADLGRMINKLASGNVKMIRNGWAMSKRTEWHLKTLLTGNDIPVFQQEMMRGTLLGFPFASTTQIPNNLSVVGSADESEVYLADFFSCVIGQTGQVQMKVVEGGAYYNTGTGSVVSGLSQDQTIVVLKMRVDFRSLYEGKDIALLNAVDWGV